MFASSLVLGILEGLLIGMLAVGIVLVYRSSRFLNLAQGQLGALSALLLGKLVLDAGLSYWLALPVALAAGGGVGVAADYLLVRRLRQRTTSTVALLLLSVGLSQLLLAVTFIGFLKPDGTKLLLKGYPLPFHTTVKVGGVNLGSQYILTAVFCPLLIAGLAVLLRYTLIGKMIRAAAANPEWARLCGISPAFTNAVSWGIAGVLSAVAAMLQAPSTGGFDAASLGPTQLFVALGAASFGAFSSIPLALVGGLVLGLVDQFTLGFTSNAGTSLLVVFVVVLAVIAGRGRVIARAFSTTGGAVDDLSPTVPPPALRDRPYVRHSTGLLGGGALFVGALLPLLPPFSSNGHEFQLTVIIIYALVAVALTMVTGWGGQLSLGHFAVVGIGAYVSAQLAKQGFGVIPLCVFAGLAGAAALVVVALPALRVRGFSLAVTTLGFGIVASSYLFRTTWFTGAQNSSQDVNPIPLLRDAVNVTSQRAIYYIALVVLAVLALVARRLRQSVPGRIMIAVRDDERASAAYGITPATVKVATLAVSGFFCGVAGVLWADAWQTVQPDQFPPALSLSLLALPVIGGLGSISGAISAAALLYLPTFFLTPIVNDLIGTALGDGGGQQFFALALSGLGIIGVQLQYPNGIAGFAQRKWSLLLERIDRQVAARPQPAAAGAAAALEVDGVELSFGGLKALTGASVTVRAGEIVGLIGANGAGKSTLINVVSGVYTPSKGSVRLNGADVTTLPSEMRAALGLGRTFQSAQLFPGLTVRETLQSVIGTRSKIGMLSAMLRAPWAVRAERRAQAEADAILTRMGLARYADTLAGDLSTGTRRICALATQVAQRPKVLLLDEPTAGVAQRETEAFGPLLRRIRDELNCAIVIVEHDMPLLMGLCDRVYTMEQGHVIAEGTPEEVRNDPRVVASYLGTDETAIERSGSIGGTPPTVPPQGGPQPPARQPNTRRRAPVARPPLPVARVTVTRPARPAPQQVVARVTRPRPGLAEVRTTRTEIA